MRIVTYLIEYLCEFEFIFETIFYYESGDQMGSFDAKKPPSKISCLGPFKKYFKKVNLKRFKQKSIFRKNCFFRIILFRYIFYTFFFRFEISIILWIF
jgi:hypothetical protein